VSVLGQVNRPGRYPVDGKRSVLDMLAMAGGIGAEGGDTISLMRKRNGQITRETIDVIQMVRAARSTRTTRWPAATSSTSSGRHASTSWAKCSGRVPSGSNADDGAAGAVGRRRPDPARQRPRHAHHPQGRRRQPGHDRRQADDLVQVDDVITVRESWF
jgi:polysaccharide export outer membrane protein